MIKFIKDYYQSIKEHSMKYKISILITLVVYLCIVSISLIKVNYVSITPGEVNPVSSLITVNANNNYGDVYTVSVYEYRQMSILQYLIANNVDDILVSKYNPDEQMSQKNQDYQGVIMKDVSVINSIIMAYDEAHQKYPNEVSIDYTFKGAIIHGIYSITDKEIQLGDIITHIEGKKLESIQEFRDKILEIRQDPTIHEVDMTILRGEEVKQITATITDVDDGTQIQRLLGIEYYPYYKINSSFPTFTINKASSSGPSGGLMQTLAIYNAITPYDVTRGLKIMGTGTIDIDGTVGEIGGIKQKVITANAYKADLFFVPAENYEDAMDQYRLLKNPSFEAPIKVNTFSEAIAYLEGLGE